MTTGHDPVVPLNDTRRAFADDLLAWARGGCEGRCPSYADDAYETWDDRDTFDATPEEVARDA
jgi:hypothetical protein